MKDKSNWLLFRFFWASNSLSHYSLILITLKPITLPVSSYHLWAICILGLTINLCHFLKTVQSYTNGNYLIWIQEYSSCLCVRVCMNISRPPISFAYNQFMKFTYTCTCTLTVRGYICGFEDRKWQSLLAAFRWDWTNCYLTFILEELNPAHRYLYTSIFCSKPMVPSISI